MSPQANQHPAVMFEIIAKDQKRIQKFYADVFGWTYQDGAPDPYGNSFAYVHFGVRDTPLLGGIGAANPKVPGFEPGHSFYFLVDDLEAALQLINYNGGKTHMKPAKADGYAFAMGTDPEGNTFGLITPFET